MDKDNYQGSAWFADKAKKEIESRFSKKQPVRIESNEPEPDDDVESGSRDPFLDSLRATYSDPATADRHQLNQIIKRSRENPPRQ